MKKQGKVCFMVVLAWLLTLTVAAQAEVYVEGFLGGNAASNLGRANFHQKELPPPPTPSPPPPPPPNNNGEHTNGVLTSNIFLGNQGGVAPAMVFGGRVGTWFVPEGALGFNYPNWMKYFGFYTDVSYHRLDVTEESIRVRDFNDAGVFQGNFPGTFYSKGYAVTWAFMFAARYGFLRNDKFTFGRVQPWVAVGPAILFTGMRPKATVYAGGNVGALASPGWQSAVIPALVVDAGVRYMMFKNLSFDLSFRYRYAQPNFNFDFTDINGGSSNLNFKPVYNLFSGMAGLAYHF